MEKKQTQQIKDRFRRVNAALLRDAAANASLGGMCTTMTAAVTHGNDLVIETTSSEGLECYWGKCCSTVAKSIARPQLRS